MLRVGLTGGLGSGKSTAARMFGRLGAHLVSSDEMGHEVMHPESEGSVFGAIVERFGRTIVDERGLLKKGELALLAFRDGRAEELNAIVHPAVIARQEMLAEKIGRHDEHAVMIVESALIFETKYGGDEGWRRRFDKLVLVTAPEEVKIARFVARATPGREATDQDRAILEPEARRRMALQIPDEQKAALCDYVLTNDGAEKELEWQVEQLWPLLVEAEKRLRSTV